ncbi:nitrite reductase [Marmoricola endophyticus]|uniref:nitrite reductase n=1 Tax=Marmoricola endophyticus TaxID=2040280 RepID=UPI00166A3980|nr:nitrite reductase [Marmoricola endophyticus]
MPAASAHPRDRRDACPGILRPWPAEDGALVRVRLVGGRITAGQLAGLSAVAREHGDGDLHLTSRANLQLRGLPAGPEGTDPAVVEAIEALGLLPSRAHDQVRNLLVSPGTASGRVDPWPLAQETERLLLADPRTARLPGKFLLAVDDGSGDLLDQDTDLLLVPLDEHSAQTRVGDDWGESVSLANGPRLLVHLATEFLRLRGDGPSAAWHVVELSSAQRDALMPTYDADERVPAAPAPPSYDERHRRVPDGRLTPDAVDGLVAGLPGDPLLVVTPWRGILLP